MRTFTDLKTGDPIRGLVNYDIKRDAVPLNPTDTSSGTDTVSIQLDAGDLENPEELMGRDVVINTRGNPVTGAVVAYSNTEPTGQVSLDIYNVYERLNTDQTCLPMISDSPSTEIRVDDILRYWAQECGVFSYNVPGYVQTYLSAAQLGYERDSISRWVSSPGSTLSTLTNTGSTNAVPLGLSQSLMFGNTFEGAGTGVSQDVIWYFPKKEGGADDTITVRHRNVTASLLLGGTTVASLTLPTPSGDVTAWDVHVLAEAVAGSPLAVKYTLRAIERGPSEATVNATATVATGNILLEGRGYNKINRVGVSAYNSWVYMAAGNTLPTTYARPIFDTSYDASNLKKVSAVQGFTGNVWTKMQELCSIYAINLGTQSGVIYITARLTRLNTDGQVQLPLENVPKENVRKSLSKRTKARRVEVVQYKLKPTYPGQIAVMWKADSVYSLEKGENKVETVQTDATFLSLENPVPVSGVPVPYTLSYSSYVVTGADGYIVDPQWWIDNGGSITVSPTKQAGEIAITMQAPNVESVRAPYRISEGVADRPALYIMGKGVTYTTETVSIYTGSPSAAQDVGVTFDSPFVSDIETAYRVGDVLAGFHGGAEIRLDFNVPLDMSNAFIGGNRGLTTLQKELGYTPEGSFVYHRGSIYRTLSTSESPSHISASAEGATFVAYFNEAWTGKTIKQFNDYYAGKLVRDFNSRPLPQYVS